LLHFYPELFFYSPLSRTPSSQDKAIGLMAMFRNGEKPWPTYINYVIYTDIEIYIVSCNIFFVSTWKECQIYITLFLNNQPDLLIIPILFCYKTLHVSGIFSAHYQEFSTVHSAPLPISQDSILSAWKRSSKTCMKLTSAECTVENSWWSAEKMPETCRVL